MSLHNGCVFCLSCEHPTQYGHYKKRLQQLNVLKMHLVTKKNFPCWSVDREGIIVRGNWIYCMATGRDFRRLPSSEASLSSGGYRRDLLVLFPWCTCAGLSISPAFCALSSSRWPVVCYVGLWSWRENGVFSYVKRTAIPVLTGPVFKPQPHLGDLLWWSTGSCMAGQRLWRWIACTQRWSRCGKVGGRRHGITGWRSKERSSFGKMEEIEVW